MAEKLFDPLPLDQQALMLAKHMPQGAAWNSCFDSDKNMGKLVKGLAKEIYRFQTLIKLISDEMDINKTDLLIDDHEKSVGIPDTCFFPSGKTLVQRRTQVIQKLSAFGGVQKTEDFERVATAFGFTITAAAGAGTHTIEITVTAFPATEDFPLPFPLPFSSGGTSFLRCLFDKLAPANVEVIFV